MLFSVCQGLRGRTAFDKSQMTEKRVSMCVLEIEPWAPQILGRSSTRRHMPKSILNFKCGPGHNLVGAGFID